MPPEPWVSEPETSDDAVREGTGRSWDEWRATIDDWGGRQRRHPEIAAHLADHHGLSAWWSQMVTVGYERITGMRLPGQMPDGTFTANVSRTIDRAATDVCAILEDDTARNASLGVVSDRRSKPGVKAPRYGMPDGIAQISLDPKGVDRTTVRVQHSKLDEPGDVDRWKAHWSRWLDSLES